MSELDETCHMIALQISLNGKRQNLYGNMSDVMLFERIFYTNVIPLIFKPKNI